VRPSRALLVAILVPLAPLRAQDSAAAIPGLKARVTRIRFFEGAAKLPGVLDRQYNSRFDSAATRSVYVEIGLAYPPASQAQSLRIECGYTAPNGGSAGTAVIEVQADAGWELSVHAGGAGSDTPGGWAAGSYPVACRHGGRVIATGAFEITGSKAARPAAAPPARRAPVRPPAKPAGPAADPNARIPAMLSGIPVGRIKARVTAIRLFESGADVPDREARTITATFDALTTRFINIELELQYPRVSRSTEFEIGCRFDGPDSTARTPTVRGSVDPGWVGSYHTAGWGARNRGMWPEGTYKVTCQGDGKTVATSEFKVVKARAAVDALGASLTHLRFFQSLAERLPVETRRYGARFDARTARWIKAEFGLVYPPAAAATTFAVECIFTFPDGSTRAVKSERRVPAGWTGSVHAQGIGQDRAGGWPAGGYRVGCSSDGREFAAGNFEVFPADAVPTAGAELRFSPRAGGTAGPPGASFDVAGFDTLVAEPSVPVRAAGDSTAFRCLLADPAGVHSAFSIEGEVRDRMLHGSGAIPALDPPRLRGSFRVECRAGDRAIAADRFTLTGKADLPAAGARLVSSALYEGADPAPDDEAVPDVTFSAARIRSLWLVALLDREGEQGGTFAYSCKLVNARNVALADTGPQGINLLPGDRAIVIRQRLSLRPNQRWAAGRLALTCASGGTTFVRTTVELTR
jgi:hypothetical protein